MNHVNPTPALETHESEAAFQAIVDPYARADFFISFGEEGVNLEEGYLTFPAIPGGLPDLRGELPACRYSRRCERYAPFCDGPLPLAEVGPRHTVACWKPL